MRNLSLAVAALAASLVFGFAPAKAETTDCTEIMVLPATINTQGVFCLKKNLVTAITSGNAITININNVTIDLNGWKLGGSAAGLGTLANGIYAANRKNITIRNGSVRGFYRGIHMDSDGVNSSGHLIEDILADGNRHAGMRIEGDNTTIRNNKITSTGPTDKETISYGIHSVGGNGVTIYGNTVSGVDETDAVWAIRMDGSSDAEIRNNRVFDLDNATKKYGIYIVRSERIALKGNTVSTSAGGTTGLGAAPGSNNLACIENQVSGFSSNFSRCDTSSANVGF